MLALFIDALRRPFMIFLRLIISNIFFWVSNVLYLGMPY
jgi:hypothetical protein